MKATKNEPVDGAGQAPGPIVFFFWLNLGLALSLVALVGVAPLLRTDEPNPAGWLRLLTLFAVDATLRRTVIASSLGLVVTAYVFFRAPAPPVKAAPPKSSRPPLPPSNVVGA